MKITSIIAAICSLMTLSVGCAPTLNIPKPSVAQTGPPAPAEPSTIDIPVSINLASMFQQVDMLVPKEQRNANDWMVVGESPLGDIGIKYELWRGPLRLDVIDDKLRVTGRVNYWFEFAQKITKPLIGGYFWQGLGSCGHGDEPPREALLSTETQVRWSNDWRLVSTTSIRPVTFVNRCRVTFASFDITGKVNEAVQEALKDMPRTVDTKIAQVANFRSVGEKLWTALQEPVRLDSAMWLVVDPQAAGIGAIKGSGQTVTSSIGLTARPSIVFGAKPSPSKSPLPNLQTRAGSGGVHITLDGELTFEDANRRLEKDLLSKPFSIVGHDIIVRGIEAYGVGDTLVIQAKLDGDIHGAIYFVGRLDYDQQRGELYARDLDYSIDTKYALANAAEWLNHEGFRRSIAERVRWPIAQEVDKVRMQLQQALSKSLGGSVELSTRIRSIRPAVVYATSTSFRMRLVLDGDVSAAIK